MVDPGLEETAIQTLNPGQEVDPALHAHHLVVVREAPLTASHVPAPHHDVMRAPTGTPLRLLYHAVDLRHLVVVCSALRVTVASHAQHRDELRAKDQ